MDSEGKKARLVHRPRKLVSERTNGQTQALPFSERICFSKFEIMDIGVSNTNPYSFRACLVELYLILDPLWKLIF